MSQIEVKFIKGLDESADETVTAPESLTECLNYRLTRAGRLEHRLGVTSVNVDSVIQSGFGRTPTSSEAMGLYGRFLAAGGYGYTCLSNGVWTGLGSISRLVPLNTYSSILNSEETITGATCASAGGYLCTVAYIPASDLARVVVVDETSGVTVWTQSIVESGLALPRVVACGSTFIITYQVGTTIKATSFSTGVPFGSLPAVSTLIVNATAASSGGYDVAPFSSTQFLITWCNTSNTDVFVGLVDANNLTGAATLVDIADGGASKIATVCGAPGEGIYACWLDSSSLKIRYQALTTGLAPIGGILDVATTNSTSLYGFGRPVIGRRSATQAIICWTDSYVTGNYGTYRTSFTPVTNAPSVLTSLGTQYGVGLASKPFQASASFGAQQTPCVWLINVPRSTQAIDSSYFVIQLGLFSGGVGAAGNTTCSWELSAADFKATPSFKGAGCLLSEVALSTASGTPRWNVAHLVAFRGKLSSTPQVGVETYAFGDGALSQRYRARALIPAKGTLAITGGAPRYHDTSRLIELGMCHAPDIVSAVADTTGSMGQGNYQYVAILEHYDTQGQRQLSAVSAPVSATVGVGQAQVQLEILVPSFWASPNFGTATGIDRRHVVCHIYRTGNNGTVFRRVTPNAGAPGAYLPDRGRIFYVDTLADSSIQGNEAVYVQVGNVRPHFRAPASRFGCQHGNRLVFAGLWKPNEVKVSKILFPGEGIQFADFASFTITCPEPVTGVASLDGILVIFSARHVYTVAGLGPTDDGVGGYGDPEPMPGRVGCIDWRSIVSTDLGIYFRSAEGIYLLPRGLGASAFVGSPVKNKLQQFPETLGATLVTRAVAKGVDADSDTTVSWLVGDAEDPTTVRVFTFSLTTQTWSEAAYPDRVTNKQVSIGPWHDVANDTEVLGIVRRQIEPSSTFPGSIQVENVGVGYDADDADEFAPVLGGEWTTGKIFPFGFGGRGTVKALRLVGDCIAPTKVSVTVWSDLDPAGTTTEHDFGEVGRFAVETRAKDRDVRWIQVRASDTALGQYVGAGLRLNGIALDVEGESGLARTAPGRRSA